MFTVTEHTRAGLVFSKYRHLQIGEPSLNSSREMTKCDVGMFKAIIECKSGSGMVLRDRAQIDYRVTEE
jgi:hypothetical protein